MTKFTQELKIMTTKDKLKKVGNAIFPFFSAEKKTMALPIEVAEATIDAMRQAGARPTPKGEPPADFAAAQARFREVAGRFRHTADSLADTQIALERTWLVLYISFLAAAACGVAGVILFFIEGPFPAIGFCCGFFIAAYALTSMTRCNIRRCQVRARALVTWQQFRRAAGSLPAAIFSDVKLSAAACDSRG